MNQSYTKFKQTVQAGLGGLREAAVEDLYAFEASQLCKVSFRLARGV